ncbi:hypothetical protein NC652_018028 [Populus alba x Populus x berolinensis]|nr:hypothetical protein NC652_018028 [Populus alba x Populus x berolinensis]
MDRYAFFIQRKVRSRHDKRILRHRYKKLAKYYSDLMVILQQNGFSWDETQQMIVADDDKVWDAYIKAHPHARTYRMKTLPNYNDLVLIYGNASENGVQSNFLEDKDLEADISRKKAEEGKGSQSLGSSDRTRTYWTPPMDRYLIDLLLDQVHRGNKFGQTFISQAWIDMAASFNVKFQSHHEQRCFLKNRQHPDARSYRVKTVPGYQKLCVIVGQENSGGRYSRLAQCIEEMPVLMTVDPLTVDWQPEMNRYFVDLMIEQGHPEAIAYKNKVLDSYLDLCFIQRNDDSAEKSWGSTFSGDRIENSPYATGLGISSCISAWISIVGSSKGQYSGSKGGKVYYPQSPVIYWLSIIKILHLILQELLDFEVKPMSVPLVSCVVGSYIVVQEASNVSDPVKDTNKIPRQDPRAVLDAWINPIFTSQIRLTNGPKKLVFLVGDSLAWKYDGQIDSVLEVTKRGLCKLQHYKTLLSEYKDREYQGESLIDQGHFYSHQWSSESL